MHNWDTWKRSQWRKMCVCQFVHKTILNWSTQPFSPSLRQQYLCPRHSLYVCEWEGLLVLLISKYTTMPYSICHLILNTMQWLHDEIRLWTSFDDSVSLNLVPLSIRDVLSVLVKFAFFCIHSSILYKHATTKHEDYAGGKTWLSKQILAI